MIKKILLFILSVTGISVLKIFIKGQDKNIVLEDYIAILSANVVLLSSLVALSMITMHYVSLMTNEGPVKRTILFNQAWIMGIVLYAISVAGNMLPN